MAFADNTRAVSGKFVPKPAVTFVSPPHLTVTTEVPQEEDPNASAIGHTHEQPWPTEYPRPDACVVCYSSHKQGGRLYAALPGKDGFLYWLDEYDLALTNPEHGWKLENANKKITDFLAAQAMKRRRFPPRKGVQS